jgi:hypothetical protein
VQFSKYLPEIRQAMTITPDAAPRDRSEGRLGRRLRQDPPAAQPRKDLTRRLIGRPVTYGEHAG